MRRFWALLIVCIFPCACGFSQQDSTKTMQILKEWSTLQSVWGVPSAQPISGSSLELIEKSREKSPDGTTIIHYNFKAKGLPENATYVMEYWPMGGPSYPFQKIAAGTKISPKGLVVCSPEMSCGDKNQPEYPLEVAIPATVRGDTHRFVLTSENNHNIWVTGIATPFPIRALNEGCQLEIVRMTLNGEMLILSGSGFPAKRDITFQGNSAGENHTQTVQTDANGHFQTSELPFVTGKDSGTLEVRVTQGADCHPSIAVEWGKGSRKFE
jgi:hypothetical protein